LSSVKIIFLKVSPPIVGRQAQGCGFPWRCCSAGMVREICASSVWDMGHGADIQSGDSSSRAAGGGTWGRAGLSSLGLGSVTRNSREAAPSLERTRTLLHPSSAPGAMSCTPSPHRHTDPPGFSSLSPTNVPLAARPPALPRGLPLVALTPDPSLLQRVPGRVSTSPTHPTPPGTQTAATAARVPAPRLPAAACCSTKALLKT